VRKFEPRVRLVRKANGGQASAFNAGIPECRGEVVAFLDGDDWWAPVKLSRAVQALEQDVGVGCVGHGIFEADERGAVRAICQPDRNYQCALRDLEEAGEFLPLRAFLGTSRFTARRDVLERILPVPSGLTIEADEYMFTMAAAMGGAKVLREPLSYYRLHSGNLYQFRKADPVRMRRKRDALECLVEELAAGLRRAGLRKDVADFLVRAAWVDAERLRLTLGEGYSWHSFRVERAAYELAHRAVTFRYRIFHGLVLAASLVLTPKAFYALRDWYSARGLARYRARLAASVAADTLTQRYELS
jgi:glycosyltransferase involved in cell wall biosynthesis